MTFRRLILAACLVSAVSSMNPLFARGFGGARLGGAGGIRPGGIGGGGIGGGGFGGAGAMPRPMPVRPTPSFHYTPSMSRVPPNRPSSGIPSRQMERPGTGTRPDFDSRLSGAPRPGGGMPRPTPLPSGGGFAPGGLPGSGAGAGLRPGLTPGIGGPGGRPSASDLGNFLELTPPTTLPPERQFGQEGFGTYYGAMGGQERLAGQERRPGQDRIPEAAAGIAAERPGAPLNRPADRLPGADRFGPAQAGAADRIANRQQFRSNFPDNRQERLQQRQDWGHQVRDNWNGQWQDRWNEFKRDFGDPGWRWEYPRLANAYFRWNRPYAYWWTWSSAAAMTGWFAGWWATPYYYDYGAGGTVYYEGDTVYYNGQPAGTPEEYAAGAQMQAAQGLEELENPPADGSDTEWLPLGGFALSTSTEEQDPTRFLQLAVSKAGTISGTMYSTVTKASLPIVGSVDRKTQRACWYVGDKTDVVAETGIFNLTQDEAPVLIHFGPDRSEEYLLVRVPAPPEAQGASPGDGGTRP